MPNEFDFREMSEYLGNSPSSIRFDGPVESAYYASDLFRRIDDHLRECKFFNGFSISRNRNLARGAYRSPARHMDQYNGLIILLRCSCGWETPVDSAAYNMCYYGLDFEDIIADTNYRLLSRKSPLRFEDELKKIFEAHMQSERRNLRVIREKAEGRFLRPLEGLEV